MAKSDKMLERMRNHPRGWRIEELKTLAERHGVTWRQPGTSHVTFGFPNGDAVTVPASKPLRHYDVRQFLKRLDEIEEGD